ncbi:hypothetical protein BDN70DRAFT_901293 [Pholiota conissans]|uniref:Uncharacterized protein n=1 Tax=Pholiota conissans TaxID=109636 RepID=A0A9P6CLS3_9AGAR|nr:hypothetical protein BDN70DRAFT_901293 [Pholiota conissans]
MRGTYLKTGNSPEEKELQEDEQTNLELSHEDKGVQEDVQGKGNNEGFETHLNAKGLLKNVKNVKSSGTSARLDRYSEDDESSANAQSEDVDSEEGPSRNVHSIIHRASSRESIGLPPDSRLYCKKGPATIRRTHKAQLLEFGVLQFPPKLPPKPATYKLGDKIYDAALVALAECGKYLLSVLKIVAYLWRWPISFVLSLFLLIIVAGHIWINLRQAFKPICNMPVISRLPVCNMSPTASTPQWGDLVDIQSESFSEILKNTAGGSALALEIKRAELVTQDLIAEVRISDLNEKVALERSLLQFVTNAKKTGGSLQKLASMVGGSVDRAVNDYALQSIAIARANEPAQWSLWRIVCWNASAKTEEIVMLMFQEAMDVLSANMRQLIMAAEYNLHMLNNLEIELKDLYEIVIREDSSISSAKSDLLSHLWTKLGWNRSLLRRFEEHLLILKRLRSHREQARARVVSVLSTLSGMRDDMDDISKRSTSKVKTRRVPVEVHIKSIQMGVERLQEERVRAREAEAKAVQAVLSSISNRLACCLMVWGSVIKWHGPVEQYGDLSICMIFFSCWTIWKQRVIFGSFLGEKASCILDFLAPFFVNFVWRHTVIHPAPVYELP